MSWNSRVTICFILQPSNTQTQNKMKHQHTELNRHLPWLRTRSQYFQQIIVVLGIITCLLAAQVTFAGNGDTGKPRPGKKMKIIRNSSAYQGAKLQYVEITGGYGIWVQSAQSNFRNADRPLFGSIEIGNTHSPVSFGIGASIKSRFNRDSLVLSPDYASAFAKYKISQLLPVLPSGLEIYGLAGVITWRSNLDNLKTVTSEFSIPSGQKDQGIGMLLGAGVQYRYRDFGLGAQFQWITGKGSYVLGDGSTAGVLTGSKQVNVILSYRIVWGQKKINCPIYSK
ncbi:MAG: hypothetical protein ACR2MX_19375 [Cyclobacteriaceae bacterium]